MTILGVDPGLEGGFAILDGDSVIVEPMPVGEEGLDVQELYRLLSHYAPLVSACYLELQQMRPQQSGQFTIGRNFGKIEALLTVCHIKYQTVRPADWSKHYAHGITEKDPHKRYTAIKQARREIAATLYPGIDLRKSERAKLPHDGLVDALLIADYGLRLHQAKAAR